MRTNA